MSDSIYQNNNRVVNGSIVGGDLTINQAVSPKMIIGPIQNILTYIRHRNPNVAQEVLDILLSTSHLDSQTKGVLDVLAILIAVARSNPPENAYSKVMNFLGGGLESICSDIACSALMRLDISNRRLADAKSRYEKIESPASYCQEVFFEYVADQKSLEDCLDNAHQFSEAVLCGVARGLLRCESYDLALSVSEKLNSIYPCFNSKIIQLIVKCANLNKNLYPTHYWLTSNSNRKEIRALADETTLLIEECKGMDYRAVGQAYAFLNYLHGDHKELINVCWSYITNIEALNKEFSFYLRATMEKDFEDGEGVLYDMKKSENDFSYRKSLIQRLSESEELSTEEAILFGHIADSKVVRDWVGRGGVVATKSDLERDFIAIELKCYAHDGTRRSKEEIKNSVETFLIHQKGNFHNLNLPKLYDLTTRLLDINLAHQVAVLLQPIIPQIDLWPSPIVKNYVRALLESDQLATLKNIVSEISQGDWDVYIWQIKARQLDLVDDKSGAIAAIESALKLSPLSLQCWHHWLLLNKRNSIRNEQYSKLLGEIPDDIFAHRFKSQLAWQILYELSMNGEFSRAERIIVNWFIHDPDLCAKAITNFHFSRSFAGGDEAVDAVAATTEHCLGGYQYTINGKSYLKLIVQGVDSNHSCILDSASRLGNILQELKVGESKQNGMQDIKLLETLPPYVAVFRLSLELRQANNDGSDCFHSFSLPEDPEEMIRELEKKIQATDDRSKQQLIYENPQFPLFLKGHAMGSGCPVHSALHHLTNKNSVKLPLPTVGEMQLKGIIIDIYAATYLGLTGLIHGFIESKVEFTITAETRAYLIDFVRQVTSDDYMRIGVTNEGKLWRVISDEVQPQIEEVLLSINYILEYAKNVSPKLVDMPPSIIQIEDALDGSTYSSLRLSITNDLPWLCIDEAFAQLSFKSGYRVINAREFFSTIGAAIEIRKKLPGLYHHVCSGLPYPLTYEEIIQMASLDDEHVHYYLAEILSMYPNAHADINSAVEHLSRVVILTLVKAYVNGEILNGLRVDNPKNNGYAERVFNVCCFISMQVKNDLNAERKLAFLLFTLINRLHDAGDMIQIVKILGSHFISGHFLNFEEVNAGVRDYSLKNGFNT
ncbi:PIN domain-containing protein [Cellvibrio sp. NN19]|uniref:GapS6b family protein n=1 Tax=Cellvibrio chitinivorans TaxID=3102792 RepID=UPI002B4079CA|nr:hypothetical protein [Cellvibrio sp. NN19]